MFGILSKQDSREPEYVGLNLESFRKLYKECGRSPRVEVSGTMYLKHRGDKLYFNLFTNEIRTATYGFAVDAITVGVLSPLSLT